MTRVSPREALTSRHRDTAPRGTVLFTRSETGLRGFSEGKAATHAQQEESA